MEGTTGHQRENAALETEESHGEDDHPDKQVELFLINDQDQGQKRHHLNFQYIDVGFHRLVGVDRIKGRDRHPDDKHQPYHDGGIDWQTLPFCAEQNGNK